MVAETNAHVFKKQVAIKQLDEADGLEAKQ